MRFQISETTPLRACQLVLLGASLIGFPLIVRAESIRGDSDPKEILDGIEVPTCGWPSVVALHSEPPTERCTGVYVGGNVILTAAHCIPRGWRVPLDVMCDEPSDCPAVGEYDDILSLDCDPGVAFGCIADDMALSNRILYAQFGERYYSNFDSGTGTTGSIRNAVPIRYCRRINDVQADDLSESDDFAYCVLAEAPNVQPTPLMMHCEADLYLTEGSIVTAVGFGEAMADLDPMTDFGGVKRQTIGTFDETINSSSNQLNGSMFADDWQVAGGTDLDPQTYGDSGGPLFLEMPDGSVRVIGIAREQQAQYNTVWPYAAWIASDPHVDLNGFAALSRHGRLMAAKQ